MKKSNKETSKASVAGGKMTAKKKATAAGPKVEKAGAPKNLSKKGSGTTAGKMPKYESAACYGKKGTK
jgi:hypothetical protein